MQKIYNDYNHRARGVSLVDRSKGDIFFRLAEHQNLFKQFRRWFVVWTNNSIHTQMNVLPWPLSHHLGLCDLIKMFLQWREAIFMTSEQDLTLSLKEIMYSFRAVLNPEARALLGHTLWALPFGVSFISGLRCIVL